MDYLMTSWAQRTRVRLVPSVDSAPHVTKFTES